MITRGVKRANAIVGLAVVTTVAAHADIAVAQRVGIVTASAPEAPSSATRLGQQLVQVAAARGAQGIDAPFSEASRRARAGAVRRGRLGAFAAAAALMGEGWRSYLQVRYTFASERLIAARREAERALDLDGGRELYAEVSLRLGAVKLELGRTAEAADDFRLAAVLDPERPVTDDEFKRSVVDAYAAAAKAARGSARRTIEVEPVGAEIEVDGRAVGRAPIAIDVDEGLHAIVVRAGGYEPAGQVVAVRPGDAAEIRFQLAADPFATILAAGPAALAPGTGEPAAQVAVEALSVYAELDAVLLAAAVWRGGVPALLGQWCDGTPIRCGAVVEIRYAKPADLPAAARRLWRQSREPVRRFPPLLTTDVRLTEAEPAPGTRRAGPERSWWKSPWLWLGTAGAALTVTSIVLFSRDREIQPVVVVDPGQF